MKKVNNLLAIFLLLASFFSITLVYAEKNQQDEAVSAIRFGWERFKLNFVRDPVERSEREMQLARWKIAEARIAAERGNLDRAERAIQENQRIMERVHERISELDSDSLTPGLDNALRVHEERIIRLNQALENANLSEEQRERIYERMAQADNVSEQLQQNRERIGASREQAIQDLEEARRNLENMSDFREEVLERVEQENPDLTEYEMEQIRQGMDEAERMAEQIQEELSEQMERQVEELSRM